MKTYNQIDPIDRNINVSKPLVNMVGKTEQKLEMDFMKSIIDEKNKLKNTSFIDMLGTLTEVEYYHLKETSNAKNYLVNTNPVTDTTLDTKLYERISKFQIKFTSNMSLENESDENTRSYITSGSIIILPRTIKPYEGDMFTMDYFEKIYTYRINSVEVKSVETDSGFECQFSLYKENFIMDEKNIVEDYEFHNELVGTTYRPILSKGEHTTLSKLRTLYNHIGNIFATNFYDKRMNVYYLKGYVQKSTIIDNSYQQLNNNYIDTYKIEDMQHTLIPNIQSDNPSPLPDFLFEEPLYYDNFLNYFIKTNGIFTESLGNMVKNDCILPFDRKSYLQSIFSVIESNSIKQYNNILLSTAMIQYSSPGVNPTLVGKYNVLHLNGLLENACDILSPSLIHHIKNSNNYDCTQPYDKMIYKNLTVLIEDTIVRYILGRTDDFVDRFLFIFDKKDELFEHVVELQNIFYLYPILGYIIEKTLAETFKDNVLI